MKGGDFLSKKRREFYLTDSKLEFAASNQSGVSPP